jgi:hypothetical protein
VNLSFLLLVVFLFLVLRLPTTDIIFNIDENIAPAVVRGMIERGDFNGNWRVAVDMPEFFQVNQFNFYSYHMFAWLFYPDEPVQLLSRVFHSGEPDQFIRNLRYANVVLQALTLVLLTSFISGQSLAAPQRMAAIGIFVCIPAMVFDTHIARAECFLYFLFLLQLWTIQRSINSFWRFAAFGVLLGIGSASKITFVLCGAMLIPEIISMFRADIRMALRRVAVLIFASVVGFCATAPYVLVDFASFLEGVNALFKQYGSVHPPHSFLEPSLGKSVWRSLHFILGTTGALLPLALFQAMRRPVNAPGLAVFGFILIAYFAMKPVFFERNINIGLLALAIFVAVSFRTKLEGYLILISCSLMLYLSVNTALIFAGSNKNESQFEVISFGVEVARAWPIDDLDAYLASCEGIVGINDYFDEYSRRMFDQAEADPIAHFSSVFSALPTSTMHTYLESDLYYFQCES